MPRRSVIIVALLAAGCKGTTPVGPTTSPTTTTTIPAPLTVAVSGRVTAVNGGQPLAGVAVTLGSATLTSDASGAFATSLGLGSLRVTLASGGILPRSVTAAVTGARELPLDAIALGGGFDPTFYRQFVRNTLDAPAGMEPLRRWTKAPQVYVKTVDEAGIAIELTTLAVVEEAIRTTASIWSNGLGVASIQRGTQTRIGQTGWFTVTWPNPVLSDHCGLSDIAKDGGQIQLNYLRPTCRCPGTQIYPWLVRHELGHAFGYWHTDNPDDVMYGKQGPGCDGMPSARERYHAAIAYNRPVGNLDPDSDPTSAVLSLPFRMVY